MSESKAARELRPPLIRAALERLKSRGESSAHLVDLRPDGSTLVIDVALTPVGADEKERPGGTSSPSSPSLDPVK